MTPREVFEKMTESWLTENVHELWSDDLVSEDLVVETPFGQTKRIEGRANFARFARAGRDALPVTFTQCDTIAIHDTTDPGVIVVEYELVATMNATGDWHTVQFIGVLTVRDDKIVHWREYQDTARITAALAGSSH